MSLGEDVLVLIANGRDTKAIAADLLTLQSHEARLQEVIVELNVTFDSLGGSGGQLQRLDGRLNDLQALGPQLEAQLDRLHPRVGGA